MVQIDAEVAMVAGEVAGEAEGSPARQVPLLELTRMSLAAMLSEFKRHAAVPVVLGDASLGRFELGGVVRAGNSATLLQLLEAQFGIIGERETGAIVLRRR